MKKIVFIVNPISGTSKKKRIVSTIESAIDTSLFMPEICYTEYAGHAFEIARQAASEGVDVVCAVGGDGTVNEVGSGLVHTNSALAIIPCGSGNGLARHLSIPLNPEKAIEVINHHIVHSLDYGTCHGRPFFCTCGVGFDAFISEKFAQSGHRGPITYVENILRQGLKYKPETYTIEDEGGSTLARAFLISCANASQYGNNAFIAPTASMKDGLIDIVLIEPFNALEAPQIAIQLFNKTIQKNSHVKTFKAKRIKIIRESEGVFHCDGDTFQGPKVIEIEIHQNSINVVVNSNAHKRQNPLQQLFVESFGSWAHLQDSFVRQGEQIRRTLKKIITNE